MTGNEGSAKPLTVAGLINLLQDYDPDLPVVYKCSCRDDICYHTLTKKDVVIDYVEDMRENDIRAVIIGDDVL